jgi:hypothetical protein
MSRKTISFAVPSKAGESHVASLLAFTAPKAENTADHWVRQDEDATPVAPGGLTITIPLVPDAFDMARFGLFLPPMVFWYWSLNATMRNVRLFAR